MGAGALEAGGTGLRVGRLRVGFPRQAGDMVENGVESGNKEKRRDFSCLPNGLAEPLVESF